MEFEVFISAFTQLFQPTHLAFLLLGTTLGLLIGVLPGLGGVAGLSLLLPFVYDMDPSQALAMMIGLLAPTTTSDTFPSVLMGIPGTSASQATVVDGFPLAKKGEGARALGAAFTASLFGGLFGAFVLTGAIFAARPIILAMGFGEQMMLIMLALSMIGMLTGNHAFKGLATCVIGLIVGMIGYEPHGAFRLAGIPGVYESAYLSDGIKIVIIGLGMFAMPEIVDLVRRHETISKDGNLGSGWLRGFKDAIANWWIVMRCSAIGCIVGALPGLGGSVVDWIAYGHVIQTSKDKSKFGTGDIRGVLAPESANNAKEGGAMIPTILFGIPGSGSYAILLSGFILIGIEPGSEMITENLDLTFTMIWSLALANVFGAGACLFLSQHIAKLTTIRYGFLAPFMLVLIFFAAFQATRDWNDLIALFLFGTLGTFMKRYGWSRPALLIGFFLSDRIETSLYQSIQVYGLSFFERPIVIVLVVLTALSIYGALRYNPNAGKVYIEDSEASTRRKWPQIGFTLFMLSIVALAFSDGFRYETLGRIFPFVIGALGFAFVLPVLIQQIRAKKPCAVLIDKELHGETTHSEFYYLGWIAGMLGFIGLVGFPIAAAIFIYHFITKKVETNHLRNGLLGLSAAVFLGALSYFLTLEYPPGLLQIFTEAVFGYEMPFYLGGPQ
ncbi:MAG: tripartite tricarboxylate transporter permease [Rhodospirillaceae bacterium]|jgi:putative tricarboxylic transport membrane protein|nr:tripartite tricarboxylate transporter permease [Rhodospirillaceae bacterium]MBT5666495.1 tripartite tricarboxylate transporter permease [Rhodospirillaceae bacterium]